MCARALSQPCIFSRLGTRSPCTHARTPTALLLLPVPQARSSKSARVRPQKQNLSNATATGNACRPTDTRARTSVHARTTRKLVRKRAAYAGMRVPHMKRSAMRLKKTLHRRGSSRACSVRFLLLFERGRIHSWLLPVRPIPPIMTLFKLDEMNKFSVLFCGRLSKILWRVKNAITF